MITPNDFASIGIGTSSAKTRFIWWIYRGQHNKGTSPISAHTYAKEFAPHHIGYFCSTHRKSKIRKSQALV